MASDTLVASTDHPDSRKGIKRKVRREITLDIRAPQAKKKKNKKKKEKEKEIIISSREPTKSSKDKVYRIYNGPSSPSLVLTDTYNLDALTEKNRITFLSYLTSIKGKI